jgi:hypothetical protein
MPKTPAQPETPQGQDWIDDFGRDAAALAGRLGPEGVEWLDRFLEDYVFDGEPLDRVMAMARELSRLPPRARSAAAED